MEPCDSTPIDIKLSIGVFFDHDFEIPLAVQVLSELTDK